MAITLGSITLPSGLIWSDEQEWSPIDQQTSYSLTGALIVEEAEKQAGRPITLSGQDAGKDHTVWMTRAAIATIRAALDSPLAQFTLTLHDGRTFTVIPRRDGNGPLQCIPMAVYGSFIPANPDNDHWYTNITIRLLQI